MNAFECYKEYLALKNHFTKHDYDYFKYNGKLRVNVDSFDKRKDKLFFQKLCKHKDLHNFLISNFAKNEKLWIRDLAYSDEAENTYKEWMKNTQSFSYIFRQELSKLDDDFNSNFICKDHQHPKLLKLYLSKDISLDSLCLLLEFSGAKKHWDKELQYDLIWDTLSFKISKYSPFINCDKSKLKQIIVDKFA